MTGPDLAHLVDELSSTDPTRRDEGAFNQLGDLLLGEAPVADDDARQIHRRATRSDGPLGSCGAPEGDDSACGRSFTLVLLALLIHRDSTGRYLTGDEWGVGVVALARVGATERDFRARDPEQGWIHVVAHAADLADEILASPRCDEAMARSVLDALTQLVDRSTRRFAGDEEDRVALTLAGAIIRGQASVAGLSTRLDGAEAWAVDSMRRSNWKAVVRSIPFRLMERGASPPWDVLAEPEAGLTRL